MKRKTQVETLFFFDFFVGEDEDLDCWRRLLRLINVLGDEWIFSLFYSISSPLVGETQRLIAPSLISAFA
jgi:hypothetical protein